MPRSLNKFLYVLLLLLFLPVFFFVLSNTHRLRQSILKLHFVCMDESLFLCSPEMTADERARERASGVRPTTSNTRINSVRIHSWIHCLIIHAGSRYNFCSRSVNKKNALFFWFLLPPLLLRFFISPSHFHSFHSMIGIVFFCLIFFFLLFPKWEFCRSVRWIEMCGRSK